MGLYAVRRYALDEKASNMMREHFYQRFKVSKSLYDSCSA